MKCTNVVMWSPSSTSTASEAHQVLIRNDGSDPTAHVILFHDAVKVKGRLLATAAPPPKSIAAKNQSLAILGL